MRVGVFFPGFDPTSGGGYSFEQEILQALLELFEESSHEFVIYLGTNSNEVGRPFPFTQKIQARWVMPPKNISPARMLLSQTAGKLGWKSFVITPDAPLQKAVERDNIQFMWFATSIFLPVEIPYVATVFDIQHRLQPWFPEVSQMGNGNGVRRNIQIIYGVPHISLRQIRQDRMSCHSFTKSHLIASACYDTPLHELITFHQRNKLTVS